LSAGIVARETPDFASRASVGDPGERTDGVETVGDVEEPIELTDATLTKYGIPADSDSISYL
jgi:hypothetical protein